MIAPTLPSPKTSPISPGERPRSRTTYTMSVAKAMFEKKLDVPVRGGDAAQVAVAEDVAQPVGDLVAQAPRAAAVLVDVAVGRRLVAPDQRTRTAPTHEADRVDEDRERGRDEPDQATADAPDRRSGRRSATISSLALPSTSWSRSTSDGRYDW